MFAYRSLSDTPCCAGVCIFTRPIGKRLKETFLAREKLAGAIAVAPWSDNFMLILNRSTHCLEKFTHITYYCTYFNENPLVLSNLSGEWVVILS